MDKDHRLDAPDEESLQNIEQLEDRSGLTTLYPHAHQEWEGRELLSREVREQKHAEEERQISLSLRKWFVPIGLSIPLPFILAGILVTLSAEYVNIETMKFWVFGVIILGGFAIFASIRIFRYGYRIFYKYGVRALPFVMSLLALLLLSLNAVFRLTQPLHTGNQGIDVLIISAGLFLLSIIYSLAMVFIWSAPRLSSGAKVACIGIMALIILIVTALFYMH